MSKTNQALAILAAVLILTVASIGGYYCGRNDVRAEAVHLKRAQWVIVSQDDPQVVFQWTPCAAFAER